MTVTFATEAPASFAAAAFKALVESIRNQLAQRAQRATYARLLEMDASQLDDLGIDSQDLREALGDPARTGRRLDANRRARALGWTPANAVTAALFSTAPDASPLART